MAFFRLRHPSIERGYAQHAGESAYPDLWKDASLLFAPILGNTGRTAFDYSGHGRDLNLSAEAVWRAGDPLHGGLSVELSTGGVIDDIQLKTPVLVEDLIGDEFTIIFRYNPGATTDRPTFGWTGSGATNRDNPVASYDGGFNVGDGSSQQVLTALAVAAANRWTQYAIVDEGSNYKRFVDGQQQATNSITISPADSITRTFVIGQSGFDPGFQDACSGRFDSFFIWRRALTLQEIDVLRHNPLAPFERKPLVYNVPKNKITIPSPTATQWVAQTPANIHVNITVFGVPTPAQWNIVTPNAFISKIAKPDPVMAQWGIATPKINLSLVPDPVAAQWNTNAVGLTAGASIRTPDPATANWNVALADITAFQRFRSAGFTPTALTAKDGKYYKADWLLEARDIGLTISYEYDDEPGVTWEHRFLDIGDIDLSVPPGGGIATVSRLRVTLAEDGTGQSLRLLWQTYERLEGTPITLKLLFAGEAFGDAILVFSGRIERVMFHDGKATLLAADDSLHQNPLIPPNVVTTDRFPNAATNAIARPIPYVYGAGSAITLAPLLLIDTDTNTYILADHELKSFRAEVGIFDPAANVAKPVSGAAFLVANPQTATVIVQRSLAQIRFGEDNPTLSISRSSSVSNASAAIDGGAGTLATLDTDTTLNSDGEGEAVLGVTGIFSNPQGLTNLEINIQSHRRSLSGNPTVTGQYIAHVLDSGGTVRVSNILTTQEYRHFTAQRNAEFLVRPITLGSGDSVQVLLNVINEGGLGSALDFYEVGEVSMTGWHQVGGTETNLFAHLDWEGRKDDASGTITGVPVALLHGFPEAIHSLLVFDASLPVNSGSFEAARVTRDDWQLDGGIGSGWYQNQIPMRDVLGEIARFGACYLFPGFDGNWHCKPYLTETPAQGTFDTTNILTTIARSLPNRRPDSAEIQMSYGSLASVYNNYELRYAYNAGTLSFDKVRFVNAVDGTNISNIGGGSELVSLVATSEARHGKRPPLILEIPWIYDDTTAERLLDHLVRYFWTQRVTIRFATTLTACHLEPGDFITVTHPHLPTTDRGEKFEVHRIRYKPPAGVIELTASRAPTSLNRFLAPQPASVKYTVTTGGVISASLVPDPVPIQIGITGAPTVTTSFQGAADIKAPLGGGDPVQIEFSDQLGDGDGFIFSVWYTLEPQISGQQERLIRWTTSPHEWLHVQVIHNNSGRGSLLIRMANTEDNGVNEIFNQMLFDGVVPITGDDDWHHFFMKVHWDTSQFEIFIDGGLVVKLDGNGGGTGAGFPLPSPDVTIANAYLNPPAPDNFPLWQHGVNVVVNHTPQGPYYYFGPAADPDPDILADNVATWPDEYQPLQRFSWDDTGPPQSPGFLTGMRMQPGGFGNVTWRMSSSVSTNRWSGCIAELWMHWNGADIVNTEYDDFIDVSVKEPKYLGTNGTTVLSKRPHFYFTGEGPWTAVNNKGSITVTMAEGGQNCAVVPYYTRAGTTRNFTLTPRTVQAKYIFPSTIHVKDYAGFAVLPPPTQTNWMLIAPTVTNS